MNYRTWKQKLWFYNTASPNRSWIVFMLVSTYPGQLRVICWPLCYSSAVPYVVFFDHRTVKIEFPSILKCWVKLWQNRAMERTKNASSGSSTNSIINNKNGLYSRWYKKINPSCLTVYHGTAFLDTETWSRLKHSYNMVIKNSQHHVMWYSVTPSSTADLSQL